jgi:hypothetical protein
VSSRQHVGGPGGHGITTGVTSGGGETPLSAVRPCGMGVPPSEALDMSRSPHLTIGYLQKRSPGEVSGEMSRRDK